MTEQHMREERIPPLRLPRAGELAPDFTLPATDGEPVTLAAYPKPVALVFLRHLG